MSRKSLKDWELEKGLKVKTHRKNRQGECSEGKFIKLIKRNNIVVKTEKGLKFLESKGLIGKRR